MKITVRTIPFGLLLLLRLWWPVAVFIGVCTGIFPAFLFVLSTMTRTLRAPLFVGGAWLLLLIVYILLGVALTYVAARLLRRSFGSEAWRLQRRMVIVSGFPFYALGFFFLMIGMGILLDTDVHSVEMIGALFFFSLAGALLFALASCSYVILTLFFLRRSTAMAYQEKGK